jgi:hypothetical protein
MVGFLDEAADKFQPAYFQIFIGIRSSMAYHSLSGFNSAAMKNCIINFPFDIDRRQFKHGCMIFGSAEALCKQICCLNVSTCFFFVHQK